MIPDFGAFLTQMTSAVRIEGANTFYPPAKQLLFNEQIQANDGLLVAHISAAEKISYEEALLRVNNTSADWLKSIQEGNKLELDTIGTIWLNANKNLQFQPSNTTNYLTSSFGLSSVISTPVTREVLKEEVVALEEKIPFIFTPEKKAASSIRPYLKYAAIFLLAISAGLTGYRFYNEQTNRQLLVEEKVDQEVTKHIQQATFFDAAPLELPELSLNVISAEKKIPERVHHIIAGAFRFKKNASKKIRQLKRRGYNPTYIGTNPHGLHMVTYDTYTDTNEALNALRAIKNTQSPDAWLLSTNTISD